MIQENQALILRRTDDIGEDQPMFASRERMEEDGIILLEGLTEFSYLTKCTCDVLFGRMSQQDVSQ